MKKKERKKMMKANPNKKLETKTMGKKKRKS